MSMQEQSGSRFRPLDIPYRTTVTPEDLAKIDAYVSQGKPPEVGIAYLICEEGEELQRSLIEMLKFPPLQPDEDIEERFGQGMDLLFNITGISSNYSAAATYLLCATGELPLSSDESEEGPIARKAFQRIEKGFAVKEELTMDEVEQKKAGLVVEGYLFRDRLLAEYPKRTPLDFVDFCTLELGRQLTGVMGKEPALLIFKSALVTGQLRFHQFHGVIQQDLPQS